MATYRYCHVQKKVVPKEEAVSREEKDHGPYIQSLGTVRFASHFLPLNWPYAKHRDKEGRAVFTSSTDIREAVRRAKDDGEQVEFHRGAFHYT